MAVERDCYFRVYRLVQLPSGSSLGEQSLVKAEDPLPLKTSVRQTVTRNATANILFFAIQSLILLISFPFVLRHFGRQQYGLYVTLTGIVTFLQFINLGLIFASTKYVAEFWAQRDMTRLQALVGNAYFVSAGASLLPSAVVLAVSTFGASLLNVDPGERRLFAFLGSALAVGTLVNGLFQVSRSVIAGIQRVDLQVRCDLIGATGPLIAVLSTIVFDTGFLVFAVITQLSLVAGGALALRTARKLVPSIRHRPAWDRVEFARVFPLQALQVVNYAAEAMFFTSDRLVLQRIYGASLVADYSVVERPRLLFDMVLSVPLGVLVPTMSSAYAENDLQLVDKFLMVGTRVYLRLVLPPLAIAISLMPQLLELWVGPDFVSLALPTSLFLFALIVTSPFKVFSHLMFSKARITEIVLAKVICAPLNLIASIFLARRIGLMGVVLPTLTYFVGVYPLVWLYVLRAEGVSWRRFGWNVFGPISTVAGCGLAVYSVSHLVVPERPAAVVATAVVATLVTYGITLTTSRNLAERRLLRHARRSAGSWLPGRSAS